MKFNKDEKAKWLANWKASGRSACAYAKENGLCQQTFYKWIKQEQKISQDFVEVPLQKISQKIPEPEILIEKGSLRIHIPLEPVLGELPTIIARLG
jgi:transposase-like protein